MNRNLRLVLQFSIVALAVIAFLPCISDAAESKGEKRRNIIFILIDDQRFDQLSCLGHPYLQTPNIDALAKDGILFENAFVTTALCSPSRASILSGQYAHVHGVLDNATALPPNTPIFPIELQKAGYETGFIGKWHMGGDSAEPRPGFNRWVSFRGQGVYVNPTFNIDGQNVQQSGYTTDLITDNAEEFIKAKRDKPFMLFVGHKAVHADFVPAPRHKDSYKETRYPHPASMADTEENYKGKPHWVRAQRDSWHGVDGAYNGTLKFDEFIQRYNETMRAVDDSVGHIVQALKEKGLYESTLIIYTSDNGFQLGEHGLIDKRTAYEASIRVPLVVHCPELFKGGKRRSEMILNIDYAPTILEAAGVPIPPTIQGRSFAGLLAGNENPWRTSILYEYFWESSFPQTPSLFAVRTDRYKLVKYHGIWDFQELYDLQNDPDEMNNLLGDLRLRHEGGSVDVVIRNHGTDEQKRLFKMMNDELSKLLKETGGTMQPGWNSN